MYGLNKKCEVLWTIKTIWVWELDCIKQYDYIKSILFVGYENPLSPSIHFKWWLFELSYLF